MSKYVRIVVPDNTKEMFDDFYEANKNIFATKATMFNIMVYNLPTLTQVDNKIVDPEKQNLKKKLQKANFKIEQLEKRLEELNSKEHIKDKFSEEIASQLKNLEIQLIEIVNQNTSQKEIANKLNDIETIFTKIVNQNTSQKEMANKLNDIETMLTKIVNQKTQKKPERFEIEF